MAGGVHGGSLGRWFEELCRIRHSSLNEVVGRAGKRYRLKPNALPKQGGVYAFWWTGPTSVLRSKQFNRRLVLHGPGGRPVELRVDKEWLGLDTELPVPLYVGKTADDISNRIGKHLRLGSPGRYFPSTIGRQRHKPPTTTCQLRSGIEHFFLSESDPVGLILKNIGLSYVLLTGDQHGANRFYLEDLAIGLMRPPINVDIER
jgi:hypothetical protein